MSDVAATRERVFAHPHEEPRSYPLMLRTWDYHLWRPVMGIFVLIVGALAIMPLVLLSVLAAAVAIQDGGLSAANFENALSVERVTPASMLYLNLSLASATLVVFFILRVIHRLRPRWSSSVLPGLRWKFMMACFGLSAIAMIAMLVVALFLPSDPADLHSKRNEITGTVIALGVVILLTTPLQAIGEEYAFRGYLLQAFGSISKSPVFAIVVTALLFAMMHGAQNIPLFADRFIFGLMAGFVVWRTGGLEAGIALHIVNNLVAFGFALTLGDIDSSLNVSEASWWNLPLTVTQNGLYLILVLWLARRWGLSRTTTPPAIEPRPAPVLESSAGPV